MSVIERTKHDVYPFISHSAALKNCANGKTVLVAGGSKGIGKAVAMHFALAGAATVIITGRGIGALEEAKSAMRAVAPDCTIRPFSVDVVDGASVQALFEGLPSVPDILINNAGAARSQQHITESDIEDWWSDYELNVKGVYLCSRAYLRLLDGKPGMILNVSSSVSNAVNEGLSSYGSAKTAVNRITEFIHAEYAKQGVRCLAFHPGGIADTGMGQACPENLRANLIDTVNLAAGTALYLSTPRAEFLAGRFVYANWDMEAVEALKEIIVRDDLLKTKVSLGKQLKGATMMR